MENQLTILSESLDKKLEVLQKIREYNKRQEEIFSAEKVDMSLFDDAVSATARRTLPTLALTIRYPSVLKTRYIAYAYEYTTSYCGCQFMVSSSSHTVLTILCSFKPFYS